MFKIVPNPTFSHDLDIDVPADGGYDRQTITVRFRVVSVGDLAGHDLTSLQGQADYCNAIVQDFENLADQDGKPISSNARIREMLLGLPYVRAAVMRHYTEAMMGAARKN